MQEYPVTTPSSLNSLTGSGQITKVLSKTCSNEVINSNQTKLNLCCCTLDEINNVIEHHPFLSRLNISNSEFNTTSTVLKHATLSELIASHNEIRTISSSFFNGLPNLTLIDLSYNQIKYIDGRTFKDLTQLFHIDLSNNNIAILHRETFMKNTRLKQIVLRNNPFNAGCDFIKLGMRTAVYLSWESIDFNMKCFDRSFYQNIIHINPDIDTNAVFPTSRLNIALHCKQQSFKLVTELDLNRKQIENVGDLLICLTASLKKLNLNGNHIGQLDSAAFHPFINLTNLNIGDTGLEKFDFNSLSHLNKLEKLDISRNKIRKFDNSSKLKVFQHLTHLNIERNHLENAQELIQYLSPSIVNVNLSDNNVGHLNASMAEHLNNVKVLNLSNTNLRIQNINMFENISLEALDISYNRLENTDFNMKNVWQLKVFRAAYCNISNAFDLIKLFGSSLLQLDLSGNIQHAMNIDFEPFERLTGLEVLNISFNNLQEIDLSYIKSPDLKEIYLDGNNLINIDGLFHSTASAAKISIMNNQFSCEDLKNLAFQLKNDEQIVYGNCEPKNYYGKNGGLIGNVHSKPNESGTEIKVASTFPDTNTGWMIYVIFVLGITVIMFMVDYFICRGHRFMQYPINKNKKPIVLSDRNKETIEFRMTKSTIYEGSSSLSSSDDVSNFYDEILNQDVVPKNTYDHLNFPIWPGRIPFSTETHYDKPVSKRVLHGAELEVND
ncbi:toll-like receptor Tollo [Sitodiplosis mosellana]|uniref:toll-like receptor Tollo n=1 Tax=Sitodiplosis mosellana TaxID=263140 RepID=UPI0024438A54|nr:toll-like receptor Tollo [Sitodiplosis mosellana]